MLFAYTTIFSLIEWLALTGFFQCVLILVYVLLRARNWRQASLTIGYFTILATAFLLQFSLRIQDWETPLRFALWFVWAAGAPLCYLLVLQIVRVVDLPEGREFWVLATVPAAAALGFSIRAMTNMCEPQAPFCAHFINLLYWTGGMGGAICLLLLWAHKGLFDKLWDSPHDGKERYWLVLTHIAVNIGAIVVNVARASDNLSDSDADALLIVLGIAFIYLVSTALFRVYPSPVHLSARSRLQYFELSEEEKVLAQRVRKLMELDKVYHEQGFSRADLARELQTSESTLSKVINVTFGKSFSRLLNELRVEDAKRMLADPNIPVQVVASEVGFNSIASFNRVFREVTGDTPSAIREENTVKT